METWWNLPPVEEKPAHAVDRAESGLCPWGSYSPPAAPPWGGAQESPGESRMLELGGALENLILQKGKLMPEGEMGSSRVTQLSCGQMGSGPATAHY